MNRTSAAIVRTLLLGTSCLSLLGLGLDAARAQPTGGNVVLGSATINGSGNLTTVTQTTGKAIINWQSFSIAAGGTVRFDQPGASAITLNRVLGPESSSIYGNLLANGQVWLINRNGVLFGAGSRINVGGLIATTSDIANGDFANGNYAFGGGSGAAVVNQGTIRAAKGGSVVLSGASVSNRGLIEAETGTVVLGGARAFTIDFVGDGLIKYAIAAPTGQADNGQAGVSNSGTIAAQGGHVVMTARAAADVADAVVNNTGMISATSAKLQNGEVVLDAGDGDVKVGGTIDASGAASGQTGGSVAVTGRNITVADNTNIDVSGDAGGGSVAIGGDAHGAGPLANAANTHVGAATIKADAIGSGNGGTLVVWSNGLTDFSGIVSARGGAAGGDGGFVETSGHILNIGPQAKVDTSAVKGQTGTWLLDPLKIVISTGPGSNTPLSGGVLAAGTDPGATDQVTPTTIITALATTNVTLQATDSITIQDPVIYSSSHDLNLMAKGDIMANASVQNTLASGGGAINLVAGWDGSTAIANIPATVGSYGNGGATVTIGFAASGPLAVGGASGSLNVYSANLTIDGTNGYAQLGFHGVGGGNIVVNLTGDLMVSAGTDPSNFAAQVGNGSLTGSTGGNVTGDIMMRVGGDTEFFSDATDSAWLGNAAAGGFKETGNVAAVTRTGFFSADFLTADLGTSADTGGNVFVGFYDPISSPLSVGGLSFNSPHDFTFAGAGSLNVVGTVSNAGTGAITLVAGWDGTTVGTAAQIEAAHAYGLDSALLTVGSSGQIADASVGSAGGLTTLLTRDLSIAPATGFFAQVGYHGSGGGDIHIVASGNLSMTADGAAADYAMIGNGSLNGDVAGNVTGNIDVEIAGSTSLTSVPGSTFAWIGNVAASGFSASGTVRLVTFDITSSDELGAMLGADTSGGDVTLGLTSASTNTIDDPVNYNGAHALNILSAGSLVIERSIQNTGGGAINIVAGWDGSTFDPAHFGDPGAFGNGGASILIGGGGASGGVAVGGQGATTLLAASVTLDGATGYAQAGYHGGSGGSLVIDALGALTLTGTSPANFAQAGSGTVFGSNAAGGAVTLIADTIVAGPNAAATASALTLTATGGPIGSLPTPLDIAANTLALTTTGGDAYLTSPSLGVTLTNISTSGGVFRLSAGGAISQSGVLSSGALNVSTTSGAITLANAGNSFGPLTVTTLGSDAATFASSGPIVVASAHVGGALTLTSAGGISQTGVINSGALVVSTTSGAITLTNGANIIGPLSVTTQGSDPASITNSGAIVVASAHVGGALTLTAGGGISQTGALVAGGLTLLSSGSIVLTDAGNAFATLAMSTGASSASVFDSTALLLGTSTVGGSLTLAAGGPISQSGVLSSGALSVSTTSGAITLTNAANIFGPLTVTTLGSDPATLTSSGAIVVASAHVGGTLTLTSAGGISQTGAIVAGGLTLSSGGGIVLTNAGNSFANLSVTTSGLNNASLVDLTGVTLGTSAVGGSLTLHTGGAIGQSGAVGAHGLNLSTTAGDIALTNASNTISGTVLFSTPGSATLYDAASPDIGATSVGGNFTVLSQGNVNFLGSVQLTSGNVIAVAGWNGVTTDPSQLGNAGVYGNGSGVLTIGGSGAAGNVAVGSQSGTTSVYAATFNVAGVHGYAQLGYHGSGGGGIVVRTLHDMTLTGSGGYAIVGNGSLTSDVVGNETGDIDVRLGGNANFDNAGATIELGNVAHSGGETGNVILVMNDETDTGGDMLTQFIVADLLGGDFTVAFTGLKDQGPNHAINYNSSHTVNILIAGNAVIAGSVQNAGSGAINLVGGWDGHTLSGFAAAGVSGNGGHGVVIGGGTAKGDVAFGSAGGQTSVYGSSLALNAVNGHAQLGFNGHGSGGVVVNVSGGVTLSGGSGTGAFAQIGNGGLKTGGNNSGDITITAGGDLALNGGTGGEAYAQIGQGGAESNGGSAAYSNTAALNLTAANVLLTAGGGTGAYSMIGNGGYKAGQNLAGTATNGGNITVTSSHAVTLLGGAADAYAQIGNGGSQSNLNPSASSTGTDSGDIVVHAPNGAAGAVTLTAGTGANSYAQIGDGGYAVNSGPSAVAANFTVGGNVSVTDLALTGGNGGSNSFAQIGNGDASLNSYGNVSGNIVIDANGKITLTNGAAPNSPAEIGNFTGFGSVSGTITGVPPNNPIDAGALGVIVSTTANNGSNTNGVTTINTIVIEPPAGSGGAANTPTGGNSGAIALLEGGDSTPPTTSDTATVVIADSLDGSKKPTVSETIIVGVLTQYGASAFGQTVRGVPDVDQDFSSDGNGALWQ
jgi:filamentous hemagglutinin family protein